MHLMAKLFWILFTLALTGCAGTHTDSLVFSQQNPVSAHSYYGGGTASTSGITTVLLPSGSYLVGRQGSTTTVIQTSRTKR